MEIPKDYDVKKAEKRWQKYWEKEGIYKFNPKNKKKIYSIDNPPPTVSGEMHLGHASMYSQMDFIARYKRMRGFNLFYPFGTDDNGLATERLVENLKNVKNTEMSRGDFVKLCLETLDEIKDKFIQDWKNIGISSDYSVYYSTINDHCRKVSQESFIELYEKGREYRKRGPTMWCPECHMAVAQVELEDKLIPSTFNDIVFKVDGEDLLIATTRPEFLPACVAVFYHPDDDRYKKLEGKKAKVPLFDIEVPILPDKRAEPDKGTGIVMCCTYGDLTDMEWQKAHNLPIKMVIDENGKITDLAGDDYKGLDIKKARKKIIEDLKKNNLLVNQKKIQHTVNVHERCGTEIEILETKQWFIKYLDIKDDLLKAGAKLNWYPGFMKHRYDNWVKGLQWDWCISRQRHFGIPIPVWYCKKCGEIILPDRKQLPVDPLKDKPLNKCKCGSEDFVPEEDVLDTWATSSLTPQITAGLFKNMYDKLYPMDLRPQSHDIITFWLFNTVVKSQLHNKVNPWKDTTISGFVLDPHGKKMSKSKGNVVRPQEVVEKYSADALRFWASSVKLGDDITYQEKDLVTGNKFVVKLWNAFKFVISHLNDFENKKIALEEMDKWALSKLNKLVNSCTESFEVYEYSKSKAETEKFFWQVFCDNYLEIVKNRLYNPEEYSEGARESAQFTLYTMMITILKLMAPIMPYITEEIYQIYFAEKERCKSIHVSEWPDFDKTMIDDEAEKTGDFVVYAVSEARRAKSEKKVSLKAPIKKMILKGKISVEQFDKVKKDVLGATNTEDILFERVKEDSKIDDVCEIKF